MTIIFSKVNGDTFFLRKITYDSTTEEFDIKTEAVETGIQAIFKCLKGSEQCSFVESLHKNPPLTEIKAENELFNGYKEQMTKFFHEINNSSYVLEHLTYNSEIKYLQY